MNNAGRDMSQSATWFQCLKTGGRSADRVAVVPIRDSAFEIVPGVQRNRFDGPHVLIPVYLDFGKRTCIAIKLDGPSAVRMAEAIIAAAFSLTQGGLFKMPATTQQAQSLEAIQRELSPRLNDFAVTIAKLRDELDALIESSESADPFAIDHARKILADLIGLGVVDQLRPGKILYDMERQLIERTIAAFPTRPAQAKFLGIGVRTLSMKLGQYRKDDEAALSAKSSEAAARPDEKEDKGPGASAA